jgi:hypothetical protein
MCGFDGALGHYPVAIEAAHVRWQSQQGPDEMANALALCALHHALFDLGVLGITEASGSAYPACTSLGTKLAGQWMPSRASHS